MIDRWQWVWLTLPILAFTGVMSCLSVGGSLFDGRGVWQHGCARFWARVILRLSRVRLTVDGLAHLPHAGPWVFAANHQSLFDIFALLAALPVQFRFAAKDSLFRIPFLGWHLRRSGNIPIHRGDPRKALRSMREAAQRIAGGVSVVIFPEGERNPDGQIQPFKKGVFLLAQYGGTPIVPVAIAGSRHCLPKGSLRIRPGHIRLSVRPPLASTGDPTPPIEQLADATRSAILTHLATDPAP